MKIKYADFQHEVMVMGGAMFHWNLQITAWDVGLNTWHWEIIDHNTGELMDNVESPAADVFTRMLSNLYNAAISTRNGGNFQYASWMVPFHQWVALEWKSVDGGVYLPEPEVVWEEYRKAMIQLKKRINA
jgi:hypothetical protein